MLYDLSPAITPRLAVWPGDTPPSREVLMDQARGDSVTLSTLRTTVHLGSHADGFNHYGQGEPGIGELSLEHFIGECLVVDAPAARGGRVRVGDVAGGIDRINTPRVLVRTGTFPDGERWNHDFAGLSVELVDALADRGVMTVGVDTPSVDLQESKTLEAHRAILRRRMAILEGLVLAGVPAGRYELLAAPLKLMGFDGSPVRAVLRPWRG